MARRNLSLPHDRRVAKLQSQKLMTKVRISEHKDKLNTINAELSAMKPPRKPEQG
jgi:hypothetical protein